MPTVWRGLCLARLRSRARARARVETARALDDGRNPTPARLTRSSRSSRRPGSKSSAPAVEQTNALFYARQRGAPCAKHAISVQLCGGGNAMQCNAM